MKKNITEATTTGTAVNKHNFRTSFFVWVFAITIAAILTFVILSVVKFGYTALFPAIHNLIYPDTPVYTLADTLRAEGQTPSVELLLKHGIRRVYNENGDLASVSINADDVSRLTELPEGNLYATEEHDGILLEYYGQLFMVHNSGMVTLIADGAAIGFNGGDMMCVVTRSTRG